MCVSWLRFFLFPPYFAHILDCTNSDLTKATSSHSGEQNKHETKHEQFEIIKKKKNTKTGEQVNGHARVNTIL